MRKRVRIVCDSATVQISEEGQPSYVGYGRAARFVRLDPNEPVRMVDSADVPKITVPTLHHLADAPLFRVATGSCSI